MEGGEKMTEEKKMNELPEAPVSVTVKVKSEKGFEYMLTMRDESAKSIFEKITFMESYFEKHSFTPLNMNNSFKKQEKPLDYVPDRQCPKCGERLINYTTKEGKKFIKCSTNKWDAMKKEAIGCKFMEWPKSVVEQTRPSNNYPEEY